MIATKDITVTVTDGDMEIRMGKALTSLYYKGVEKFVFRTDELSIFVDMVRLGREKLNEKP